MTAAPPCHGDMCCEEPWHWCRVLTLLWEHTCQETWLPWLLLPPSLLVLKPESSWCRRACHSLRGRLGRACITVLHGQSRLVTMLTRSCHANNDGMLLSPELRRAASHQQLCVVLMQTSILVPSSDPLADKGRAATCDAGAPQQENWALKRLWASA